MESSTPIVPRNDLRRRTLLKNAINASPLRRSLNTSQTPVLEVTNDENERSHRRNSVEIQKRLSCLPQSNVNLNESYLKQQFAICAHLFTENKINAKNVWKLQIIDMLKPLCQKSNKDTLQIASTSIDISAKVYSLRVDDVHADSLKLASNMARVVNNENQENDDDEQDGDDDDANKQAKQKKKKKKIVNIRGPKSTISKAKTLLKTLPKLEPIDFTTRVNADTGHIDNLYTNILKEDNSSCTFILLDKNKTLFQDKDSLIENIDNNSNLIKLSDVPRFPAVPIKINPHFDDFKMDDWDPDKEDEVFNIEKQVVFDDRGIPIPELDGSIHDIFLNNDRNDDEMNNDDDDIQSVHEEMALQVRGEVAHIVDFRSVHENAMTSEYSFNSVINTNSGKFIDQIWAGPHHWKLKFIRRSTMRFSGQKPVVKVQRQGKKRVQPESLDYQDIEYSLEPLKIKKRPPIVDLNKITLPTQSKICIEMIEKLKELMLRPGVCPMDKKATEENQLDYEVNPYKYENPNDSLYCSQNRDDDHQTDGDDFNIDEEQIMVAQQNYEGDNLVNAPPMVAKWQIPYALKAKQMDMKKLKAAIWQKLTNPNNFMLNNIKDKIEKVIPQTFSEMYKYLPDFLAEKEKKDLTCPLAFVALLHLCNEQNLHLTQLDDYKDFHIQKS